MFLLQSRRVVLITLVTAILASGNGPVTAQDAALPEEILSAWRHREQAVRSARFELKETITYPKHTQSGKSGRSHPEKDATFDQTRTFSLQDLMLRHTTDGPKWNAEREEFVPRPYACVTNGVTSKAFHGVSAASNDNYPVGFVKADAKHQDLDNYHIYPILVTYRPLYPGTELVDTQRWRVKPEQPLLSGVSCVVIAAQFGSVSKSLWLDPARGYVPLRQIWVLDGRTFFQLDVTYGHADLSAGERVPVPIRWHAVHYETGGGVHENCVTTTVKSELNRTLPKEEFEFEFPVGTKVRDSKSKEFYIIRDGSAKRIITDDEMSRGSNYEELLATESGQAGLVSGPGLAGRSRLMLFALGLTVVGVGMWLVVRRKSLSPAVPPGTTGATGTTS